MNETPVTEDNIALDGDETEVSGADDFTLPEDFDSALSSEEGAADEGAADEDLAANPMEDITFDETPEAAPEDDFALNVTEDDFAIEEFPVAEDAAVTEETAGTEETADDFSPDGLETEAAVDEVPAEEAGLSEDFSLPEDFDSIPAGEENSRRCSGRRKCIYVSRHRRFYAA